MRQFKYAAAALILLSFIAATAITLAFTARTDNTKEELNRTIAQYIGSSIQSGLAQPVAVAKAISADTFLHGALMAEEGLSQEETSAVLAHYLGTLQRQADYASVFVVSERTRCYYTPSGIAKILDPQKEPYDVWYQLFMDSGRDYALVSNRDHLNGYRWTLFVNCRILDKDGSVLGVCGVGILLDTLQEQLSEFESAYDVKISLVQSDGLVQVDTDSNNIASTYLFEAIAECQPDGSAHVSARGKNGICIARFLSAAQLYLVVQGIKPMAKSEFSPLCFAMLVLACAVLLALLSAYANSTERKHAASTDSAAKEDRLTNLPNRNYFKEAYGELGIFNTTRYKSLAVFDIDKFKILNDTRYGDKIIVDIVAILKEMLAERGIVFRWGGDEFVVLMELSAEESAVLFKEFCKAVKKRVIATVSVGIVPINLADTIKTNYYRAVQLCYAVKESGGNGARAL